MICLEIVKEYLIIRMICLEIVKEYLHGVSNAFVGCSSGWLKCTIAGLLSNKYGRRPMVMAGDGLGFFFFRCS